MPPLGCYWGGEGVAWRSAIKISSFQYLSHWFPGQHNLFIKATGKTAGIRYCFLGILSRLSFGLKIMYAM